MKRSSFFMSVLLEDGGNEGAEQMSLSLNKTRRLLAKDSRVVGLFGMAPSFSVDTYGEDLVVEESEEHDSKEDDASNERECMPESPSSSVDDEADWQRYVGFLSRGDVLCPLGDRLNFLGCSIHAAEVFAGGDAGDASVTSLLAPESSLLLTEEDRLVLGFQVVKLVVVVVAVLAPKAR